MKPCKVWLLLLLALPLGAQADEFCFGGVGQQCGGISMAGIQFAACTPVSAGMPYAVCAVSGGSMTHDPCCASNPRGKMCGGEPENASQCATAWNRAVSRFVWGYQWTRVVDTTKPNNTGLVVRADYCAKEGKGVHRNDVTFCCAREARMASFWERLARPNLRICR